MSAKARNFRGFRSCAKHFVLNACVSLVFASSLLPALADGVFVFKWNKQIDINEPTQKAIIVYDGGREDLLLQVRYEGPLEEFGWLIPVPSIPTVEKGSMEAFYELSQLTQRRFGATHGAAPMVMSGGRGPAEEVKVIEIKTVGAYEVAILSARDSGSLARWLQLHGYSIPEGQSGIVDDYVSKGWYFVAAKIQLGRGDRFKLNTGFRSAGSDPKGRAIQRKLASGELHPVLITFDTPTCVFPLRISAISGKPSEVSLYVVAAEPLLNRFMFEEACEKLDQRHVEWEREKPRREAARRNSMVNTRAMSLAFQLYAADPNRTEARAGYQRAWSREDVVAMSEEAQPVMPPKPLDERFFAMPEELLPCLRVEPHQIAKAARSLTRLKGRSWFVAKSVRTFAPKEMRDLEFQPAIPVLVDSLSRSMGRIAADVLASLGSNAIPALIAASRSTNSTVRINATSAFERLQDGRLVDQVLRLLKDGSPQVRLLAVRAAGNNWDKRLADPLVSLFHDPYREICGEATGCLAGHESRERTAVYLDLLKDSDPKVRLCALGILLRVNRDAVPTEPLIELVRDPDPEIQAAALKSAWQLNRDVVPRADLLPLLGRPSMDVAALASRLIEGNGRVQPALPEEQAAAREREQRKRWLTSSEATPLATNQLSMVRFMSLNILKRNADAKAIELILRLLRDPSPVVRSRAFAALQSVTGQNLSQTDATKWEEWWAKNRDTFRVARPAE